MEAALILIISVLGLILLVVAVVSVASNLDKQNTFVRKTNENQIKIRRQKQLSKEEKKKLRNKFRDGRPNSIQPIKTVQKYKYPEATRRLKERTEKSINEEPEIKTGKRGGRYTEDKTKDGRPYRRYF